MHVVGCGVDQSASSPADSAVLEVTPTGLGSIMVALAYPGYQVYTEAVSVIQAYGWLAGVVTDATSGDSLSGAALSGFPAGADTAATPRVFETVSGGSGAYAAPDSIPVGTYDIYATKFGYLAYADSTLVRSGANTFDVEMAPAPSGIVSGTVTEEGTGRPITATIDVYRSDNMSLFTQTHSDSLAGGAFATDHLPYFTYRFRVSAPRYMTFNLDVTVDESVEAVDFVMTPTQGNLLVIDDYTGASAFETKFGPKGEAMQFNGDRRATSDGPKSAALIAQDLTDLGYDVTSETSASTDPGTWTNYDVVIWSSGDDSSPVAVAAYRSNLNSYATDRGKLIVEGGEIGYDAASSPGYPNFADSTLHVVSWHHDSSGNLTVERPTHPIATSPNVLPATIALSYANYGDEDALTPDSQTEIVFDWSSYPGQGGLLVYDDTPDPASAQIVFYSFDYASVTDAATRRNLLENTVAHLLVEESAPEGSVSGQVVLSGESSHQGVIVRTTPMGLADTTDAAGSFLIEGLFDATYEVTASKTGFADSTVTVEITGGASVEGVDFTLYPVLEYSASPERAIPDNNSAGIRVYIDVPADANLASVDCHVNITHTFKGDLVAELTSPEGTKVRLHNRTGGSANDLVTWYDTETQPDGPGTMADFAGEWAEGRWELYVADLASIDTGTLHAWALRLAFPPATSSVEGQVSGIPKVHFFETSRPNPFTGTTSFRFGLPQNEGVRLAVYDVQGRNVTMLADHAYPAGIYTSTWDGTGSDGRPVASGVYFCRFTAGAYSAARRIVYVK
jgi:subtilisin-like proprotein convertase family protein